MSLLEFFRIALSGLSANRLRAMLTTLGIIIGVGAVIGLASLGRGVDRRMRPSHKDPPQTLSCEKTCDNTLR